MLLTPGAWGQQPELAIDEDPEGNPYVAGELLVTYEEQASAPAEAAAKEDIAAEVEEELPEIDAEVVSVPEVENESDEAAREEALEEAKQALEQDPAVESSRILDSATDLGPTGRDPYYGDGRIHAARAVR